MNFRLLKLLNQDANPTQGGSTGEGEGKQPTGTEAQEKPFKSFATEADYQKEIKSLQSKAKHEILAKLGVSSVDAGQESLNKGQELQADLQKTIGRLQQLEEENAVMRVGINDDLKEEALILARAKVSDNVTLEQALKQVAEKFPNLAKTKKGVERVGGDKQQDANPAGSQNLTEMLAKKYPWIKTK